MSAPLDLTTLTVDELKALKQRWYAEAWHDGSLDAIARVARTLGRQLEAKYGPKYVWEAADVSVYLDDYGRYLTVMVDGRQVCSTHTCTKLFVPGTWMDAIRAADTEAQDVIAERDRRRVARERGTLLAMLGGAS